MTAFHDPQRGCSPGYRPSVSRTTIDINDEHLAATARELGTTSTAETVNAALA